MRIPLIKSICRNTEIEKVAHLLDAFPRTRIANQLWSTVKSNCETHFTIVHTGDTINLKYFVKEDVIKINAHEINGTIHKDNCVEFFIAFEGHQNYFNIEMNCAGICRIGYGKERLNRALLDPTLISTVKTHIKINTAAANSNTKYAWELTAMIPIEVFEIDHIKSFHTLNGHGNFFKCGDDLPQPHFYSWSNITSTNVDFHVPQFFGELAFE